MTEEIMVDGIDVSGCSLFNNKTKACMYSRETCNAICDYGCYARNEIIDRLEQENKQMKSVLEEINKIAEPRFVNGLNEEADLCNLAMDRIQTKINEVLGDEA